MAPAGTKVPLRGSANYVSAGGTVGGLAKGKLVHVHVKTRGTDRVLADVVAFALRREGFQVIQAYDGAIYVADAALYLMSKQPDLGIKNPYQLTQAQFDAAIKLLEQQRDNGALYWGLLTDQVTSYAAGDIVTGTTWQYQVNLLQAEGAPIASTVPPTTATAIARPCPSATRRRRSMPGPRPPYHAAIITATRKKENGSR